MSLADLGIVAVIGCNLLFLLLCTYLAWRMLNYMRDSTADLSAFANSLKAHAGRLCRTADDTSSAFADMKSELGKLIDTARTGMAGRAGNGHQGRPADPYQQWAARDPKALNRLIDQQGNMLDEVSKIDASQFNEWRREKQVELDRLLQQKAHVQQEFQRLRASHDEAVHRLREQELKNRHYQRAAAEAGALRSELQDMRQQLQHAQTRAFQAEQQAQSARAEAAEAAAPPAASPRVKELAAQLAESDADRQRLRRQLEQIQDNLKRTLTEKSFIEDRFMQLDAELAAAPAAARQEPALPA